MTAIKQGRAPSGESISLLILRLMSDKKSHTIREMAATLDLTIRQVQCGMVVLRKNKCMYADDLPYSISLDGVDWLYDREERAKRLAAKAAIKPYSVGRPRKPTPPKPVAAAPVDPYIRRTFVPAPAASDSIVSTAMQGRPALQAAWGRLNA